VSKIYHVAYGLFALFLLNLLITTGANDGRVFDIMQRNYYASVEKAHFTGCASLIHFDESSKSKSFLQLKKSFYDDCRKRATEYRNELEEAIGE
jgi:hypothetical protein